MHICICIVCQCWQDEIISKYISIPDELVELLDKKCPKDGDGKREETYSMTILRLLKKSEAK